MKRLLKFSFLMVMASMLMVGVVGCGSSGGSGGTTPTPGPPPAPTDPMIGTWVIVDKGPASPNFIGQVMALNADGSGTLFGLVITWSKTGVVLSTQVTNGPVIKWTIGVLTANKIQMILTTNNNVWYILTRS